MRSLNSSGNAQKSVPPEYVPPMSLHRFCEITGLSKVSAWRYEKRGWLRTHLLANRRYILAADVAEFNRRLASDEFAGGTPNLSSHVRCNAGRKETKQLRVRHAGGVSRDLFRLSGKLFGNNSSNKGLSLGITTPFGGVIHGSNPCGVAT